MITLEQEFGRLGLGSPGRHAHLAVFPLLREEGKPPFYLTLDEAFARGTARVTEVSAGGHVPELRFANLGDLPILILDGEELVGAKQNRVLNLTILAPAKSELIIPVSCVEQGRWHAVSAAFAPAPRVDYQSGRAERIRSVSAALAEDRAPLADQAGVWRGVAAKRARLGVKAPTGAMADLFEALEPRLEEYVKALAAVPGQVGAVFAVGGLIAGLEVFDSQATLAKLLPKLIRSYALDALEVPGTLSPIPSADAAMAFLSQVAATRVSAFPGIGMGQAIRLQGPGLIGAGLVVEEALLHLAAFRLGGDAPKGAGSPGGRMTRASRRFA